MRWWHVRVRVAHEAADALSAVLESFPDVQGVQMEGIAPSEVRPPRFGEWFDEQLTPTPDVEVSVYFPETYARQEVEARMESAVRRVREAGLDPGPRSSDVSAELVDESEWKNAWREQYPPIPVGDSLVIAPVWAEPAELAPFGGRHIISIEPGMAFGTGHHQTTQMCAEILVDIVRPGMHVLDVGTGTGVLAMTAAVAGAERVVAVDIDPVAVSAAKENVRMNGLAQRVEVREGDLLSGLQPEEAFHVAVANILRDVVLALIPDVRHRLLPGGWLLTSGYIESQREQVERALGDHGFSIVRRAQKDDWVSVLAVKS
ncbi:50S ribosomal protein L11 methyltransferase [Alicyclobacillus vulcanalis]|uniref:Ribosomal protein L11 methyltransferase n=1 Tax=Alicyclobacillus vulcanalis TaxID=252246 RepID=A0A1N7KZ48_9BACL|nr:50S ribosomal protein L11 methyltransferase [Alicyclobacillus vulcanalis]SIS66863.1 [LSU ribosomal protein L11P]-lysine N-methyltransferase [Alicyclobacillus vulcanalis]